MMRSKVLRVMMLVGVLFYMDGVYAASENNVADQHISLDFQDISTRAVLQIIADFAGRNMVVSDKVIGNITLHLQNIFWEQALDIIVASQGLYKRQMDHVILIDTYKEQEVLKDAEPIHSALLQIRYAKALELAKLLKDKNTSLLSPRGVLSVDVRTNTIWLQDTNRRMDEIKKRIQQLDVPVKQVSIEARIVNLKKDCELDLGIRWGFSKPNSEDGASAVQTSAPLVDRLNLDLAAVPLMGPATSVGVALAKLGQGRLLDMELSALESEGRAKIVASPSLMTINQQPAIIQSGEDIPYQQSAFGGVSTVAFKKAVLSLKVTPEVTPDGKLFMGIEINQDADSGQKVLGVPIIATKSIQTNVLVNNAQTIVLGGIYQQKKSHQMIRVPFLGKLPILGHLFRSQDIKASHDELLIFITPRVLAHRIAAKTVKRSG